MRTFRNDSVSRRSDDGLRLYLENLWAPPILETAIKKQRGNTAQLEHYERVPVSP